MHPKRPQKNLRATNTQNENSETLSEPVKFPLNLQTFLPFRLMRAGLHIAAVGDHLHKLLEDSGYPLGEREWRVISTMGSCGDMTHKELVETTRIDPSTISRAVKTLLDQKLLGTQRSASDKRIVKLFITKEGARVHDRIAEKRLDTGHLISEALSEREQDTFLKLLDKIEARTLELGSSE